MIAKGNVKAFSLVNMPNNPEKAAPANKIKLFPVILSCNLA